MGIFSRKKAPKQQPDVLPPPRYVVARSPSPFVEPELQDGRTLSPLPSPSFHPDGAAQPRSSSSSLPISVAPSASPSASTRPYHSPRPSSPPSLPSPPPPPAPPRQDLSYVLPPFSLSPPKLTPIDLRRQSQQQLLRKQKSTSEFGAFEEAEPGLGGQGGGGSVDVLGKAKRSNSFPKMEIEEEVPYQPNDGGSSSIPDNLARPNEIPTPQLIANSWQPTPEPAFQPNLLPSESAPLANFSFPNNAAYGNPTLDSLPSNPPSTASPLGMSLNAPPPNPPPFFRRRSSSQSGLIFSPPILLPSPSQMGDNAITPTGGGGGREGAGKRRFRGFFASSKADLTSNPAADDGTPSNLDTSSSSSDPLDLPVPSFPASSSAASPSAESPPSSLRQPRPTQAARPSTYFLPNSLKIPFLSSSKSNSNPSTAPSSAHPDGNNQDEDDDAPLRPPSPATSFRVISARHIATPPPPPQFEDLLPPASHPSLVDLRPIRSRQLSSSEWRNSSAVVDDEEEDLVERKVPVAAFRRRKSEVGLNGVGMASSTSAPMSQAATLAARGGERGSVEVIRGSVEVVRSPAPSNVSLPSSDGGVVVGGGYSGRNKGFVVASRKKHGGSISSSIEPMSPSALTAPLLGTSQSSEHRPAQLSMTPSSQPEPLQTPTPSPASPPRPPRSASRPNLISPSFSSQALPTLAARQRQQSDVSRQRRPSSSFFPPTEPLESSSSKDLPDNAARFTPSPSPLPPPSAPFIRSQPHSRQPSAVIEPSRSSFNDSQKKQQQLPQPASTQPLSIAPKPLSRYEAARAAKPKPPPKPQPPAPVRRHYSSTEDESAEASESDSSLSRPTSRSHARPRKGDRPPANIASRASSFHPSTKSPALPTKPLITPPPGVDKILLDRRLTIRRASVGDIDKISEEERSGLSTPTLAMTKAKTTMQQNGFEAKFAARRGSESAAARMDRIVDLGPGLAAVGKGVERKRLQSDEESDDYGASESPSKPKVPLPSTIPVPIRKAEETVVVDSDEDDEDDQPLGMLLSRSQGAFAALSPAPSAQSTLLSTTPSSTSSKLSPIPPAATLPVPPSAHPPHFRANSGPSSLARPTPARSSRSTSSESSESEGSSSSSEAAPPPSTKAAAARPAPAARKPSTPALEIPATAPVTARPSRSPSNTSSNSANTPTSRTAFDRPFPAPAAAEPPTPVASISPPSSEPSKSQSQPQIQHRQQPPAIIPSPRSLYHNRSEASPSSSSSISGVSGQTSVTGESQSSGQMPITPRASLERGRAGLAIERKRSNPMLNGVVSTGKDVAESPVEIEEDADAMVKRRNERRRNEARNAIELGNVVNGPPPMSSSDEEDTLHAHSSPATYPSSPYPDPSSHYPYPPMPTGYQGFPPLGGHGGGNPYMQMQDPSAWAFQAQLQAQQAQLAMQMSMGGMGGGDPAMHYQAMMMAKQQFQAAMAAEAARIAGEQWEMSSNMGGGMSDAGSMIGGGGGNAGGWAGMGGGMMPSPMGMLGMGYPGTMGGGMYGGYAASAYGGGGGGSQWGGSEAGGDRGGGWGSRSEYGGGIGGGGQGSSTRSEYGFPPSSRPRQPSHGASDYGGGGARSGFLGHRLSPSASFGNPHLLPHPNHSSSSASMYNEHPPPRTSSRSASAYGTSSPSSSAPQSRPLQPRSTSAKSTSSPSSSSRDRGYPPNAYHNNPSHFQHTGHQPPPPLPTSISSSSFSPSSRPSPLSQSSSHDPASSRPVRPRQKSSLSIAPPAPLFASEDGGPSSYSPKTSASPLLPPPSSWRGEGSGSPVSRRR